MDTSPSWLQGACSNSPHKLAGRSWEIQPCFIAEASIQSPGTWSLGDKVEEPLLVSSPWDVIRCSTLKQEKQTDNKIGGGDMGGNVIIHQLTCGESTREKQYWFFLQASAQICQTEAQSCQCPEPPSLATPEPLPDRHLPRVVAEVAFGHISIPGSEGLSALLQRNAQCHQRVCVPSVTTKAKVG